MAHFVLLCTDIPGGLSLRLKTRDAHIAYISASQGAVVAAGPLLNEAGEMIGSLIVLDVADRAAAQAWSESDPYRREGVFAHVDIHAWRWTIGAPEAGGRT